MIHEPLLQLKLTGQINTACTCVFHISAPELSVALLSVGRKQTFAVFLVQTEFRRM